MTERERRAVELLRGLMSWAPDDLEGEDEPEEWREAREFLSRLESAERSPGSGE